MKGTRYVDGVLVSQEQLNNTDNKKGEAIKERFGAVLDYGIVNDGTNPLTLTNNSNISVTISSGEAFCDFNRNNTSPGHGNTGERIYIPQTLTELTLKNGPISSPDQRHIFLVYLEVHKDRKLDESNVSHYTLKEDSYIIAQLTDSELSDLTSNLTVYSASNTIHSIQTDLYDLTDSELDDTFGSGKWTETSGVRYGGVTVTAYNSVYLGTIVEGEELVETGVRSRPNFILKANVLQLPDIEQLAQESHRVSQHANGIIGGIDALKCVVDATLVPDALKVTNLSDGEYAYMNGQRVGTGELLSGYTVIEATDVSYFPAGSTDYFVYAFYDINDGIFKTAAVKVADVDTIVGIENYLLLCKVYIGAGQDSIYAYNGDNRYNTSSTTNPVTDLRNFGTLDTFNISDEAKNELSGDNLLNCGNFEQGENEETPQGWNGSSISLDNTNALGGKFSLQILDGGIAISDPIPYNQLSAYSLDATLKSASTSTVSIGLRGYPGKDYIDTSVSDDATDPLNISYYYPISDASITSTWSSEQGRFNRVRLSDEWLGTTGNSGTYSYPTDISLIKYVRIVIKNTSGSAAYVDNIKLFECRDYHHDDLTIDGDVVITGDLTVDGTTTTINTTTLDVEDINVTLNKGGANGDGSGITIEQTGTDGSLIYDSALASKWKLGNIGAESEIVSVSDIQTLTDKRLTLPKINSSSTTNITSAELETLSNGSNADTLHSHVMAPSTQMSFRARRSSDYTIPSHTNNLITFNAEDWDNGSKFSSHTWTPGITGKYLITASIQVYNSRWSSHCYLYKNGTVIIHSRVIARDWDWWATHNISTIIDASGGDYFRIYVYPDDDGGGVNIKAGSHFGGTLI